MYNFCLKFQCIIVCLTYLLPSIFLIFFFFFLNLWFISSAFSVQFKTECSFYTTISSEHDFKILFLAKLPAVSLSLNFFFNEEKNLLFLFVCIILDQKWSKWSFSLFLKFVLQVSVFSPCFKMKQINLKDFISWWFTSSGLFVGVCTIKLFVQRDL